MQLKMKAKVLKKERFYYDDEKESLTLHIP